MLKERRDGYEGPPWRSAFLSPPNSTNLKVRLLWQKWTSRAYDKPDKVKEELAFLAKRRSS